MLFLFFYFYFICWQVSVRRWGSISKLNTFRDGIKVIKIIFTVLRHYKPMLFFSGLSLFIAIFGFIIGWPVIEEYFNTNYISHLPLALLAASFELISVILMAVAFILDSIAFQNKMNFELMMYRFNVKN
jgi:hypothetical protein